MIFSLMPDIYFFNFSLFSCTIYMSKAGQINDILTQSVKLNN